MQIQVHAHSDAVFEQVSQLLGFYLSGLEGEVGRIDIVTDSSLGRLGAHLYRCHVCIRSGYGWRSEIEETQPDLALAITRALDRSSRTIHRRLKLRRQARCA